MKERSLLILWDVLELIKDPARFSEQLGEDSDGVPCDPSSPAAVKWSLVGALARCGTTGLAVTAVMQVSGWDLKTLALRATHADLLRILNDAILWLNVWREYPERE